MQLWVNHILEMYNANQNGLLDHSQWEAMELDITAFTKLPAMKESWSIIKGNYPTKFHVFMDGLMKESS